jgi:hypothetical protein
MEQRGNNPERLMSKLLVSVALSALLMAFCSKTQAQKVPGTGFLGSARPWVEGGEPYYD